MVIFISSILVYDMPGLHTSNINRKWLYAKTKVSRRYSAETITDADDLALLAKLPTQVKSQHPTKQQVYGH